MSEDVTHYVEGKITLDIDMELSAISEEDALNQAKEILIDFYKLHSGPYHTGKGEMDIEAFEFDEE